MSADATASAAAIEDYFNYGYENATETAAAADQDEFLADVLSRDRP